MLLMKTKTKYDRYVPDHSYRILIIWCFGSGKTNVLLNLIYHQPNIDKIHLDAKDPYETKYEFFINKLEKMSLKYSDDDPEAFIEYWNEMQDA